MESYVINIYKRDRESSMIVGIVEKVGSADRQAFHTPGGLLALLHADDRSGRRREGRLKLRLPLIVEGVSRQGKPFRKKTTLEDLSPHGARFFLKENTDSGTAIQLIIDPDNAAYEITATVVWSSDQKDAYETGVSF